MNAAPPFLLPRDDDTIKEINEFYRAKELDAIEKAINYTFTHKAYLCAALTHPSKSREALTIDYNR